MKSIVVDENEEFFISGSEDGDIKVSVNEITWFEYNRVLMRQAHGKNVYFWNQFVLVTASSLLFTRRGERHLELSLCSHH